MPKSYRKYYAEVCAYIDSAKDVPCMDCGGRFPPECMDFDHVRGVKKFNVGGMRYGRRLPGVKEEMAKCEIVCANCHRVRSRRRAKQLKEKGSVFE